VTYDRRGISRSKAEPSSSSPGPATLATQGDDAHRLLASLTKDGALVFGTNLGALIALDLAIRHGEQIDTLVAHEPTIFTLLGWKEQDAAIIAYEDMTDTFHRAGDAAALMKMEELRRHR
jgi:pimeloyl-ACP methyl ester carboxylesterase